MLHPSTYPTGLLVDLYHIDAAYIAWKSGIHANATFDLYTRHAPYGGSFLLTAGLQPALEFVSDLAFTDSDIAYLRSLRPYDESFFHALRGTRFTGEILAMPEGEIAFAHEPLLRVTAPFIEALLIESGLLHIIGFSSLIATKAARIVEAACGRPVAEFGYRRAQEPFLASRSAFIGGCTSTSFVAAAEMFGIPASGTVPHALIEAFPSEVTAFRAIAESLENYSLLLDTYDVEVATHTAAEIAIDVRNRLGHNLVAVRLDSGDLDAGSRAIRNVLDSADLRDVRIVVSGDLDEWKIADLVASGAPIDGFGVGTSLAVGAGSVEHGVEGGALGAVYKLAWYEGDASPARIKIAGEKSTWPGKKQVVRHGVFEHDVIQLDQEPIPVSGLPLLRPVMTRGVADQTNLPSATEIRNRAIATLAALPSVLKNIRKAADYPVVWSDKLVDLRGRTLAKHGQPL